MEKKDIAITGMSCLFPGANDLDTYWKNILAGKCAIGPVPKERNTHDALEGTPYSEPPINTRGGFLPSEIPFSPLLHGVVPSLCEDTDPEQLLIIQLADRALRDTGIDPHKEDLRNSEIILGRGGYLGSFIRQGYTKIEVLPQVVDIIKQLVPEVSHKKLARIRSELKSCFDHMTNDKAAMGIPNATAGRIANRYNMMGPSYTVDAACASTLIATDSAVMSLRNERCDRVITGGSFLASCPSFWWLFVHLEALSSSGNIKPFSKLADGMLAGEGIGLLVLERVEDAVKAGRRIYAVIKGVGTSSDGKGAGLLAPRKEGQIECLRRAYQDAGIDPNTIELLEGHGTATKIGDKSEMDAVNEFFGPSVDGVPTRAMGSVKSMIGHLMPASGAASLIKTALSLYHKILPPTICDDDPNDAFKNSQFYLNTTTRPWVHPPDKKRRAGVNAFGFGGVNGHVVLEEHKENSEESSLEIDDLVMDWPAELFLLSADTIEGLKDQVKALTDQQAAFRSENKLMALVSRENCQTGDKFLKYRLAIIAKDYDSLAEQLDTALTQLEENGGQNSSQHDGIYFESEPLKKNGKIAFVYPGNAFPGLGEDYGQRLSELCLYLPLFRYGFDVVDRDQILEDSHYRYSTILFSPTKIDYDTLVRLKKELRILDNSAAGVFASNTLGYELMTRLGVIPDMFGGTSLGEWSACISAGMIDVEQLGELGAHADKNANVEEIIGAIGLAMCHSDELRPHVEAYNGNETNVAITMDLSPKWTVFAGPREHVESFCKMINEKEVWAKHMNLFPIHSFMCQPIADHLYKCLEGLEVSEPTVPAFSAAIVDQFPSDSEKLRRLLADNAVLPMQMRGLFLKLYDEGARIFVQLGGGGKFVGPLEETLEGKPFAMVTLDSPDKHPIHQVQHVLAALYAHHTPINTDMLFQHRTRYLDRTIVKKDKRAEFVINLEMPIPGLKINDPTLRIDINKKETITPTANKDAVPPPTSDSKLQAFARQQPQKISPYEQQAVVQPSSPWEEVIAEQMNAMTRLYAMQKADEMNDMSHFMNMLNSQAQMILSGNSNGNGNGKTHAQSVAPPMVEPVVNPAAVAPTTVAPENVPAQHRSTPIKPVGQLPFSGSITEHVANQSLVIKRKLSLASDLFLKDHAFIPCPNNIKAPEEKLPTLPMAVALEIMSEAAQTLFPDKAVCGLKDIANRRWIGLSDSEREKTLVITAKAGADEADGRIGVLCSIALESDAKNAILTGTVLLGDQYYSADGPLPIQEAPQATQVFENFDPKQAYRPGGLYHGRCFQGLDTILKTTDRDVQARLRVPPADGFFKDYSSTDMILPAQAIDVASQLICCYDLANKTKNNWVAPVSIDQIWIYNTPPFPGEQITERMIIRDNSANLVRFDVVLESGNGVFLVISGWRDWRMKWSDRLRGAWANPSETLLARKIEKDNTAIYSVKPADIFGIDLEWLARFYLNAPEYENWCKLPKAQQSEHLIEHIAIKDATRGWLQQKKIFVYPSQIITEQNTAGLFSTWAKDNAASELAPISVLTDKQNGEVVAMAVPAPIEDFAGIKIDLFSELPR